MAQSANLYLTTTMVEANLDLNTETDKCARLKAHSVKNLVLI